MDRIKASPVADLPLLASRLDELAREVDEWPLVNAEPKKRVLAQAARTNKDGASSTSPVVPVASIPKPGSPSTTAEGGPATTASGHAEGGSDAVKSDGQTPLVDQTHTQDAVPVAAETKSVVPAGAHKKSPPDKAHKAGATAVSQVEVADNSLLHTVQTTWSRWWGRLTEHVSAATRDLVRVSRIDEPDAVLLSPEQAVFLRENLKLRLLNARLSLLSRQVSASRADMQAVKTAMTKYFDPASPVNKQAQQALGEVLQASRSLELPRPDDTLAALAKAAGGR
ncbi:MAG: uroporphyrinogen-III C-methyltransferase [Burkholderiales bacterium]|nr:uroporphyrinogen-III C-methyltransferase [Burkholderiales bacterium]